ncbi:hypothetical protein KC726_05420 [Candidatus Woesebacteria bacterium]|nr:hypothetical protein [Candidatus Woesebacteria bacterium]
MNKTDKPEQFWSGFSAGMFAGGLLLYAFATKQGRTTVKKLLKQSEDVDGNIEKIIFALQKISKNKKNIKK